MASKVIHAKNARAFLVNKETGEKIELKVWEPSSFDVSYEPVPVVPDAGLQSLLYDRSCEEACKKLAAQMDAIEYGPWQEPVYTEVASDSLHYAAASHAFVASSKAIQDLTKALEAGYYNAPKTFKTVGEVKKEFGFTETEAKDPHYPHECPRCHGPAYMGAFTVDCKRGCQ